MTCFLKQAWKFSVLIFVDLTDDGEGVACGTGSNGTYEFTSSWSWLKNEWILELPFLTLMLQMTPSKFISMDWSEENSLQNGHLYPYRGNYAVSFLSFRRTFEKFGFGEKVYLLALNYSKDRASTTLLGNLRVKNFFIITNINLLFLSLKPFPLVLSSTCPCKKSLFMFLVAPFRYCKAAVKMLP